MMGRPVDIITIHEAKTHLSRLVDDAVQGDSFIIAKAGTPLVTVVALDAPEAPQRIGFLAGEVSVLDDFATMGADEIAALFGMRCMKFLLDTQVVLWAASGSKRITPALRRLLMDARHELLSSAASMWEPPRPTGMVLAG